MKPRNVAAPAARINPERFAIAADWHRHLAAAAKGNERLADLYDLLGDLQFRIAEPHRKTVRDALALVSRLQEQHALSSSHAARAFEAVEALSRR